MQMPRILEMFTEPKVIVSEPAISRKMMESGVSSLSSIPWEDFMVTDGSPPRAVKHVEPSSTVSSTGTGWGISVPECL
jgi:hypothetical protein